MSPRGRGASRAAFPAVAFALLLYLCCSAIAQSRPTEEWPGFRGAAKQGWSQEPDGPIHWSRTNNVAWKTSIPGEGHSSPIVWGDSVYVTTAYASPRQEQLRNMMFWATRILAAVLLAASLPGCIRIANRAYRAGTAGKWRTVTGAVLSAALIGVVWGGGALLHIETHDVRAWQYSILVLLACVVVACLAWPLRSRLWLGLGLLTVAVTLPAWFWFPDREELFHIDGVSAAASVGLVAAPALLGFTICALHWLARRGATGVKVASPHSGGLLAVAIPVMALLLGLLQFVDSNQLRRKRDLVRAIVCVDLRDGNVRWTCEGLPGPQPPLTRMNTPATPTPVTDGERILAWFGSAGLLCASREGLSLWSNTELLSEPHFGPASSPVLRDGIAVLVSDLKEDDPPGQPPRSWIAGVDVTSGKVLWRKVRQGHSKFGGYSTPVVQDSPEGSIVWVHGWQGVDGYTLRTGEPAGHFAYELKANHLVAGPSLDGDHLVIVGPRVHQCLDLASLRKGEESVLWSAPARGEISSSPLITQGLLFLSDESGLAVCLDAATGKKHWDTRLPKRYFASVVAAGNNVYFSSESGRTTVVARAPELRVLAENDLDEAVYASIAVSGERILIRSAKHLYCILEPSAGTAQVATH